MVNKLKNAVWNHDLDKNITIWVLEIGCLVCLELLDLSIQNDNIFQKGVNNAHGMGVRKTVCVNNMNIQCYSLEWKKSIGYT